MPAELRKPCMRKIGSLVVIIDKAGLTLRGYRRSTKYSLTWQQVARLALDGKVSLTAEQWDDCIPVVTGKRRYSMRVRTKS